MNYDFFFTVVEKKFKITRVGMLLSRILPINCLVYQNHLSCLLFPWALLKFQKTAFDPFFISAWPHFIWKITHLESDTEKIVLYYYEIFSSFSKNSGEKCCNAIMKVIFGEKNLFVVFFTSEKIHKSIALFKPKWKKQWDWARVFLLSYRRM